VNHPLALYAATKRACELMAHSYSHLYRLPTTGLRFFTVYGPWGRPDMALFIFTKKILAGEPIEVFNQGRHTRGFTFVSDIIEGTVKASDAIASPDPAWNPKAPDPGASAAPFRILNIGNSTPVSLEEYIGALEHCLGRKAERVMLPIQPGDVPETSADITKLESLAGYKPTVSVQDGVRQFVRWYMHFYG
jgi:UDP-glucuronate 4-epimerase